MTDQRTCRDCEQTLPADAFEPRRAVCKPCRRERKNARERAKRATETDVEKEARREQQRERAEEARREKTLNETDEERDARLAKQRERRKAWREANPEAYSATNREQHAKRRVRELLSRREALIDGMIWRYFDALAWGERLGRPTFVDEWLWRGFVKSLEENTSALRAFSIELIEVAKSWEESEEEPAWARRLAHLLDELLADWLARQEAMTDEDRERGRRKREQSRKELQAWLDDEEAQWEALEEEKEERRREAKARGN